MSLYRSSSEQCSAVTTQLSVSSVDIFSDQAWNVFAAAVAEPRPIPDQRGRASSNHRAACRNTLFQYFHRVEAGLCERATLPSQTYTSTSY